MFAKEIYTERRASLKKMVDSGLVLLLGNEEVGMNYLSNPYHFRQDSSFLYFFGLDQPGLNAVIDLDEGTTTLFGDDYTIDDIVWMGPQPKLKDSAAKCGVSNVQPSKDMADVIKAGIKNGKQIHFLPPYRHVNMLLLSNLLNQSIESIQGGASEDLIKAVVELRAHKGPEEVAEIEKAVNITGAMHVAVMKAAAAGKKECELAGIVNGIAVSFDGQMAYPIILSKDGQTLHNHHHGNTINKGDLVLGDFGSETTMHYAGDITRTFPVDLKFTEKQKAIYELVLGAEVACIEALKPGVPYQEIHLMAAKYMAEGLKELGLMKGDINKAVEVGAHALFFPHGLGHMMGLDVHDMEDLGENFVGYSEDIQRSDLFGTAYLRLGRKLEPGFVLTVEPGLYFIPELIDVWKAEGKFTEYINYDKVEEYRDFGGIRIEDNVLITEDGYRILGNPIPKTVEEVEALRAS